MRLSSAALEFAHEELLLPDNGSYRHYFDTGQPYVVWNVVAAPVLSTMAEAAPLAPSALFQLS